ncbi:MAG: CBS domain-containing protein [Euryarchaeota archaeon]|jgi:predicted transcriptional regulator|nr:CBS domain-containing protein [Euryarchaeota archaeon]MBT4924570.1 CBS domain-containing protein [Euryarchaeota archaeon]MBT5736794.1 CBS domain-containing protein [Euryarchaeota archaeon]MBT7460594.1 CBS domain-containing protein [Euryarchaeota archaeon]MDG1551365.1 CBS domain-containing protein [Candidatus Poseidoniaceae archaeon]
MTQETRTIAELNLNDEHITVGVEDTLREGAKRLLSVPGGILIVLDDDSRVKGVMGYKQFLQAIDKEMDMSASKCGDIMEMDFMEVKNTDSIKEVLKQIKKRSPQAVVSVDGNGEFSGYFSPSDYKESRAIVRSLKSLKL